MDERLRTVVSENATALVVRTSDARALSALRSDFERGEVTATLVVVKTEEPCLARCTVRRETNETVVVKTVRVSAVGKTTHPNLRVCRRSRRWKSFGARSTDWRRW